MADPDHAAGSPLERLRKILQTVVAALGTRVELLAVEWQEETIRFLELLVLAFAALFLAQAGLLLVSLAVVALFPGHAALVLALLGALELALGVTAARMLVVRLKHRPPPFAATVAELKKDREWLNSLS